MAYILYFSRRLRSRHVARPLKLRISLERNIAITRALLPSLIMQIVCTTCVSAHLLIGSIIIKEQANLYEQVTFKHKPVPISNVSSTSPPAQCNSTGMTNWPFISIFSFNVCRHCGTNSLLVRRLLTYF